MSIKLMSEIWLHGPDRQSDRFVLLALADYANDDGECWPSVAGVTRKTCMTERGVQKVLRRLEDAGWLTIEAGGGRKNCNIYRIKNPEPRSPRTTFTPNQSAETPNESAENPEPRSPEPSITIIEPSVPPCSPPETNPVKARLPEGWTPTDEDREYAHSLHLNDTEIQEIADDFHAYWTDRTDAGGRKSERGWKQTWRNRCRDVAPKFIRNRPVAFGKSPGGYGQGGSIASIAARRHAGG